RLFSVNSLRIELKIRIHERQPRTSVGRLDLAVEAGMPAGVTGRTGLFDADPDRILVAIGAHLDYALDVAGGFALAPQRLTRPAVVPGFAGRNGLADRLLVHMRDHQHLRCRSI